MPRFAATDAAGRTLLSLSYAAASGEAVPLITKGSALPATNEVVVTTSGASQSVIKIVVCVGARAAAAHCALLGNLTVRVTPRPRGLAQIRLRARVSGEECTVEAYDLFDGAADAATWTTDEDDAEIAEDLPSAAALDAALPLPWKYELPYHDEPHDAFYIGGRLLWVRHEDVEEASARRRQGFDGRADAADDVMPGSTAWRCWPSSYCLATALGAADVNGKSVLELGAGSSLPGLAAYAHGAAHVALTDLEENLPLLRHAIARNGADDRAAAHALDWCAPPPPALAARRWDVVLAADCVFWPQLFAPLLATLAALADEDTLVLLAVTSRLGRDAAFRGDAERAGWTFERWEAGRAFPNTAIWRLRKGTSQRAQA